jgi:hypothetical protein
LRSLLTSLLHVSTCMRWAGMAGQAAGGFEKVRPAAGQAASAMHAGRGFRRNQQAAPGSSAAHMLVTLPAALQATCCQRQGFGGSPGPHPCQPAAKGASVLR